LLIVFCLCLELRSAMEKIEPFPSAYVIRTTCAKTELAIKIFSCQLKFGVPSHWQQKVPKMSEIVGQ